MLSILIAPFTLHPAFSTFKSYLSNTTMIKKDTIPYYIFAFAVFMLLKILYRNADHADLYWLLAPTNYLFALFMDSQYVFNANQGFIHSGLNIVINKSCSGGNFFILVFMMMFVSWISIFRKRKSKFIFILTSLFASYFFTIIVNTSRIVVLSSIDFPHGDWMSWIHEAVGSFIYLFFLVLFYQLAYFIFHHKFNPNERSF